MHYAIFTRRFKGTRKMHAVRVGETHTVCKLPVGVGSGLVRDGDYRNNIPCHICWNSH